jgi:hypothetical protein
MDPGKTGLDLTGDQDLEPPCSRWACVSTLRADLGMEGVFE